MRAIDWSSNSFCNNTRAEAISSNEGYTEINFPDNTDYFGQKYYNQNIGYEITDLPEFDDSIQENIASYNKFISGIKRILGLENANGNIENNFQGIRGNCEFLAVINSFIDKGENLKDVITVNNDGSVDVKFYNNDGKTIHIENWECTLPFYKIMGLSIGDKDVKALEIAYYKMLEDKGRSLKYIWSDPPGGYDAFTLLFSPDKYVIRNLSNNSNVDVDNKDFKKELKSIETKYRNGEIDEETYKFMRSELIHGPKYRIEDSLINADLSELNGLQAFTGTFSYGKRYLDILNEKKQKLIDMGYDEKEVAEAVKRVSKARAEFLIPAISGGRYYYNVPTKSGKNVELINGHGYTFLEAKDGYVKIRNPWNNQGIIEIPELYYKLIFEAITYARPKTAEDD